MSFDEKCEAVAHLRTVEIFMDKDALDPVIVEEFSSFVTEQEPYPQLNPKVLDNYY